MTLFLLPLLLIALFVVIVLALQRLDERDAESIHDGPDWRDSVPRGFVTPEGKRRLGQ